MASDPDRGLSGWGIFFLVAFVFIVIGGCAWIIFTQYRARRLGLPAPSLNPFTRGRRQQNSYVAPSAAAGGIGGWIKDKVGALKSSVGGGRSSGGAYEPSGGYGRGGHRGFGPLDPDEAWDSRVGNEADYGVNRDGYYEEHDLGSPDMNSGPYGGHGYGGGSVGVGGIEETRGRAASRQRELDSRYDEEMHGTNPFGDNTAERSNLKNNGSRPTVDTTVGASVQKQPHHKNQQSLGAQSADSPSERRSIFREDIFGLILLFFHLLITTHDNHIMPSINDHCADEVKPGKKCANCHSICYRSTDCQRADWKTHKMLCAAFEGVRHPSAPGMTRLLMFTYRIRYDPNKGLPDPLFCRMPVKLGPVHHPVAGLPFGTDVMLLAVSLGFAQHPKTGANSPNHHTIQAPGLNNLVISKLTDGRRHMLLSSPVLIPVYANEHEANESYLINEPACDARNIADVARLLQQGVPGITVHHSWHHDGILVLTLEADNNISTGSSNRKITVRTTASFLVIGHTRGDIGKIVMLRLSDSMKPLASVGLEIFTTEGLWEAADFEWCSGLQIKWQPHTAKNGRMSARWGRNKVIEG
ncbi:hypothetical protein D6C99_08008 [Aureobasidium pullulans]|nr:hypothetical protein D6C99_08008 [Aureobasidium pullulans]